MIYRYIYKITCLYGSFKDHYYYGQHTTENLEDGYFSSGRKVNDYKKKYPNGYKREIIAFYDTEEELNKAEYEIIHPCLNDPMCLNIVEGGYYGRPSYETRKKISEKNKISQRGERNGMYGKHHSEETRRILSEKHKGVPRTSPVWNKGIKNCFTEEWIDNARNRMQKFYENPEERLKQSERLKGRKSWCKGIKTNKIWMHYKNESPIYVNIDETNYYISLGYTKGRGKLNVKNHRKTSPIKGKHKTIIDGKIRYI